MKRPAPRRRAGFTLVELLTVVAIIAILAALTIAGFGYFNRKQAEDKTRVQIKLLENALEEYKLDYGFYPPATIAADGKATETFTSTAGTGSTNGLYMALYGNGASTPPKGRIYLAELDPTSFKQGWIDNSGGTPKIVDPFNTEYRYRKLADKSKQKNPDFDLWSCGPNGKSQTSPTHADNRDDIW